MFRSAAGLSALALLATACAAPAGGQTGRTLIATPDGPLPAAHGVWASPEQGWILEIDRTGITRWQDTEAGCYPSRQDGPTLMGAVEYRYFTPEGPDRARFEYLPSDGHAVFDRLDALPDNCGAQDLSGPVATFNVFAAIFAEHYAFFAERGVDWEAAVAAARPLVHDAMSEAELFAVLSDLIAPLGDSHTKLIAEFDGERHRFQAGLGETLPMIANGLGETPWLIGLIDGLLGAVLDPGARHIANDRIIVGTLENGRVGYIQIFTMGGFDEMLEPGTPDWAAGELATLHAVLDEAFADFAGTEAVILDLSNNRGGYDAITRAIASRFTDTAFEGYSVRTDRGGAPAITYDIEPWDGARYTRPVYVLTSDVTVSAGEITTMMLRQLPHVTQAGTTTRGAFSTPLAKPLPNGWYLELTNEIFADASGTVHEAHGLEPEIALTVFDPADPVASHGEAVRALARHAVREN